MTLSSSKPRSALLGWLCLTSAIVGGLWIIMMLVMIITGQDGKVPSHLFPGVAAEYYSAGYGFVSILILLTAAGLAGVYMMWKLHKAGFYIYAISKTALYFLPAWIIGSHHLSFVALLLTSVPIVVYGVIMTGNRRV